MAQQRGEIVLLELESKALTAVGELWKKYQEDPDPAAVPKGLVAMIVEVHKMVMQRMNAKYGMDGTVADLKIVREALKHEMDLVDKMIEQQSMGIQ